MPGPFDGGGPGLFALVPIFIGIVFVLVLGGILYAVVKGVSTWAWNNQQPVLSRPARLVAKRTETRGSSSMNNGGGRVSTWYYATFETDDGGRQEFGLSGREYGLLAEGDQGTLTSQGTRYQGFTRAA